MKKFNEQIKIEVNIDTIANQLLEMFNPEEKHKEEVVYQIIGNLKEIGRLSPVYNAMNGHIHELNYEVGEKVISTQTQYYQKPGDEECKYHEIGECKVSSIDEFKDSPIQIRYEYVKIQNGEETLQTGGTWCTLNKVSKIPVKTFKVGDKVFCTTEMDYRLEGTKKSSKQPLGECEIKEIDFHKGKSFLISKHLGDDLEPINAWVSLEEIVEEFDWEPFLKK